MLMTLLDYESIPLPRLTTEHDIPEGLLFPRLERAYVSRLPPGATDETLVYFSQ